MVGLRCGQLFLASLAIVSMTEQLHDKTGGTYEFCHLLGLSAVQARKMRKNHKQ